MCVCVRVYVRVRVRVRVRAVVFFGHHPSPPAFGCTDQRLTPLHPTPAFTIQRARTTRRRRIPTTPCGRSSQISTAHARRPPGQR